MQQINMMLATAPNEDGAPICSRLRYCSLLHQMTLVNAPHDDDDDDDDDNNDDDDDDDPCWCTR